MALRAGQKVTGAQIVNARQTQTKLRCQCGGGKLPRSQPRKQVADQRSAKTAGELWLFITPSVAGVGILRILADAGQG